LLGKRITFDYIVTSTLAKLFGFNAYGGVVQTWQKSNRFRTKSLLVAPQSGTK
jgi:hypothetical protein